MTQLKHYSLVSHPGFWKEIHDLLCNETKDIEFIPNRIVECYNENDFISDLGDYLLTEEEANNLRNHPKIKWIGLDQSYHPNPDIQKHLYGKYNKRFVDSESKTLPKILRNIPTSLNKSSDYVAKLTDKNRTNWALKRSEGANFDAFVKGSKFNGFETPKYRDTSNTILIRNSRASVGSGSHFPTSASKGPSLPQIKFDDINDNASFPTTISFMGKYYEWVVNKVEYEKTGENVDVIIQDSGVEQYHPEFIDRFTRTASDDPFVGRSRVRDLVLDGPYYLDPEVFNTGVLKSHKTFKADGRPTCTREGAILWWSSYSNRSTEYATDTVGKIDDIRAEMDFIGTRIAGYSNYPYYEKSALGGPVSKGHEGPDEFFPIQKGSNRIHGTGCAGVSCGKNFGAAVDARIWSVTIISDGTDSISLTDKVSFKAMTIFHKAKKAAKNTTYAYSGGVTLNQINKSPTIVNASWGDLRPWFANLSSFATTPQSISCQKRYRGSTSNISVSLQKQTYEDPAFSYLPTTQFAISIPSIEKQFFTQAYSTGYSSPLSLPIDYSNAESPEYDESLKIITDNFISSGIIYVAASGNYHWYTDSYEGSDYNNYFEYPIMTGTGGITLSKTTKIFPNRRGHPSNAGGWDSTNKCFKTFSIGGIDNLAIADDSVIKEKVIDFSSKGPGIDLFGFGSSNALSATTEQSSNLNNLPRYDNTNPSSPGVTYYDQSFSGTSCATPIVTGVFALYLEENPNATYLDVRNWMNRTGSTNGNLFDPINNPSDPRFFSAQSGLWGSPNKVIYNPYVSIQYSFVPKSSAFATVAESAPDTVFTSVGVSKAEGVSLLRTPPSSTDSTYPKFVRSAESVDRYIETTPSALSTYKTVVAGFGGRNNGGNAKWERQVDAGNTYFAAAGGGGGGYYGGAGGNIGGGGGGGSGLAREDASDVAFTSKGSNTGEGYVRIWLNEKSDGSRAEWKNPIIRR